MRVFFATAIVCAALVLQACAPMRGFDSTARTAAPGNDRFARVWCEAELPGGELVSCPSARAPTLQPGQSCYCRPQASLALIGRVVARPNPETVTAASPAYTENR